MSGRRLGIAGVVVIIIGVALLGTSVVLGWSGRTGPAGWFERMTGNGEVGPGMMAGRGYGPGMMGAHAGGAPIDNGPQPGDQGFVAGTTDAPRVIQVLAGPGYTFTPSSITVQRGETVTFEVTTMGPMTHEFMVGPADAVAADREGTPVIDDIGMMETKSLTYTFDGSGPYAFACHAPGHDEAGMKGTITVVG
jgi:uncharacterized cupredoxin-like copper-binding protein